MKTFKSNGKLLISGEYVVLDGANALALPTAYGQSLTVEANGANTIDWRSYNENGAIWYNDTFIIRDDAVLNSTSIGNDSKNQKAISDRLIQILSTAKDLNPNFLNTKQGYSISTLQDFNRQWGLGTSSTLINNIANWANIDAYQLLNKTFGGSGYDIACAQNNTPITYQLLKPNKRLVEPVVFNPSFKDQLYFVYLNQKQNSRDGIKAYKTLGKIDKSTITAINRITQSMISSKSLLEFEALIVEHESIIGHLIEQPPIKSKLFNDFKGAIKSLGAWGGDFILVTSTNDPTDYFTAKGYPTIVPYQQMVLN